MKECCETTTVAKREDLTRLWPRSEHPGRFDLMGALMSYGLQANLDLATLLEGRSR